MHANQIVHTLWDVRVGKTTLISMCHDDDMDMQGHEVIRIYHFTCSIATVVWSQSIIINGHNNQLYSILVRKKKSNWKGNKGKFTVFTNFLHKSTINCSWKENNTDYSKGINFMGQTKPFLAIDWWLQNVV